VYVMNGWLCLSGGISCGFMIIWCFLNMYWEGV